VKYYYLWKGGRNKAYFLLFLFLLNIRKMNGIAPTLDESVSICIVSSTVGLCPTINTPLYMSETDCKC
jgi:hypothetical protein